MLRKLSLSFALLLASSLWAADTGVRSSAAPETQSGGHTWLAMLDNGFSIQHYRREAVGVQTRLYLSPANESFVDVPSASIVEIRAAATNPKEPAFSEDDETALTAADIEEVVAKVSSRYGIDADLIRSVIAAESGFNPGAVSPKGAQGLMQLMPETASGLGVEDALDPEGNIDGGTRYLRELLLLYNGDVIRALAAYNAGPHRVQQYKGVPPYAETQAYVRRVIQEFNRKKLRQKPSAAGGSK